MRTTIELKPEHREALLAIASRRGESEVSGVLAEAIDLYLKSQNDPALRRDALLALAGSIPPEVGEKMKRIAADLRKSWR